MKKSIRKYFEKFPKGNNFKSYIKVVILFWILLLLEPFFISSFNELLANVKVEYTSLIFFLTIIILACHSIVMVSKLYRCYRPNDNLFIASGLITLVFLYYKFEVSPFISNLEVPGSKKYLIIFNILIIFPIFQVLLKVSGDLLRLFEVPHRNREGIENTSLIDYDDHPEVDLFNRKPFALKIANELRRINDKKSISIGVLGQWGEGKTTVLKYIEKDVGDEFIILKFNPWKSSSPKLIKDDFFDLLKYKLSYYDGRLSSQIEEYLKVISSSFSNGSMSYLPNFHKDQESIFKEVNESIEDLPKRVLIFIDDLDRLDKKEVKEIIKLVRNYANFSNCIFIVAYDKNRILESLEHKKEFVSNSFLDKIFQVEITLPKISIDILANELKVRLIKLFPDSENEISSFISKESTRYTILAHTEHLSVDDLIIGGVLKNLRDVVRLCNSLVFSLKSDKNDQKGIEGEVDFTEYLYLAILKLKSITIYNKLKTQNYLSQNSNKLTFNEEAFNNEFKEKESIDSLSKRQAIKLLKRLFGNEVSNSFKRSIAEPSFYSIFFDIIHDGNFSIVEFSNTRKRAIDNGNSDEIIKYLSTCVQKMSNENEIRTLLESIKFFENKIDFENVIDSLFYLHAKGIDFYSKITSLLSKVEIKELIKVKILDQEEDALKIAIYSINKYRENIEIAYLLQSIIRSLLSEWNEFFIIPKEKLEEIALNYFKEFGFKKKVIDKYTLAYFGACLAGIDPITKKFSLQSEAINYFKDNKDEYPLIYSDFKTRVGSSTSGPLFALNWLLKEVFGSWDSFYVFIESKKDVDKDFLKFMKEFKNNNFDTVASKDGEYINF